jgi:uroporphyrinogen III methyltransferase / synthase
MQENVGSVQSPLGGKSASSTVLGRVYLVGAGPGDPGLLTLRGRECLEAADFVLYDGLTNTALLDFAHHAQCISVGKHGEEPLWTQSQINDKMVELARAGHAVVRLKGGDPAVFARTAEELEVLIQAEIPFEVVPGITAALAAASYVGIPITHRHHASAVALITGQQQADGPQQPIDWDALARFPGTIVFYMGVTTVAHWSRELLKAGKASDTPAAIVRRCSWSDQSVVRCRLDEIADLLTPASKMRPPVIVIIGTVAALGEELDWFTQRPLNGCGILVTRATEQSDELVKSLRQLGAEVYSQPVLEIIPPQDMRPLEASIHRLANGGFQGVTFSSANGVDGLLNQIMALGYDARIFARTQIASVGPSTANQLKKHGLKSDIVPSEFSAEALLHSLPNDLTGQHWLVTSTNRSRETLTTGLRSRGAQVTTVICYETAPVQQLKPGVRSALHSGRIQWVTITSAAIADNARQLLREFLPALKPLSFSKAITQHLAEMQWPAAAQATEHTAVSLTEALIAATLQQDLPPPAP